MLKRTFGALILALASTSIIAATNGDFVKVQIKGQLHSDDGNRLTIESDGHIFRLDVGDSQNLRGFAAHHDRDTVIVSGSLSVENDANGNAKRIEVVANHMESVATNVSDRAIVESADREVVVRRDPPTREREVIIERREREPIIKVGPLEIGR